MHTAFNACGHARWHGCGPCLGAVGKVWVKSANPARQRGVSLFIVMIILLLSLIITMGGLAVAHLNESLVGNQSDAQRAYAAAQALIDAAQTDILLNNGYACNAPGGYGTQGTNPNFPGSPKCIMRYPYGLYPSGPGVQDGYSALQAAVGGNNQCWQTTSTAPNLLGVCISNRPDSPQFLTLAVNNNGGAEQMGNNGVDNGASYNTYIQAALTAEWGGSANAGSGTASTNLALRGSGAGNFQGRYWVEVFPYYVLATALSNAQVAAANVPVPDGTYPFIFRITAMSQGLRGGTVSVLRTFYVPYPAAS